MDSRGWGRCRRRSWLLRPVSLFPPLRRWGYWPSGWRPASRVRGGTPGGISASFSRMGCSLRSLSVGSMRGGPPNDLDPADPVGMDRAGPGGNIERLPLGGCRSAPSLLFDSLGAGTVCRSDDRGPSRRVGRGGGLAGAGTGDCRDGEKQCGAVLGLALGRCRRLALRHERFRPPSRVLFILACFLIA